MFASWIRMHERCGACAYRFEREEGYWLGAMYVNYIVTGFFGLSVHVVLGDLYDVPILQQILIILPGMVATPILLFRHARSLWATLDLVFDPPRPADRQDTKAPSESESPSHGP